MSRVRPAARFAVTWAVSVLLLALAGTGGNLAVSEITGLAAARIAGRLAAAVAMSVIIVRVSGRQERKFSGRHRKAAAQGSPGAVPGNGAGTGAVTRAGAGGPSAHAGSCACWKCRRGLWPVSQARLACQTGTWNEFAELTRARFRMVPSDDLGPDYTGEPGDMRTAMNWLAVRYGAQSEMYQRMYQRMHLRLLSGPPSFAPGGPVTVSGSGYASGGVQAVWVRQVSPGVWKPVNAPSGRQPPGGVTPGITGFSEAGALTGAAPGQETVTDGGLVVPDSFEPVRGYRWWTLNPAPVETSPAMAEANWPRALLRGVRDTWAPGENVAQCLAGRKPDSVHPAADIPLAGCGCGFWSYWQLQHYEISEASFPVCGVVDGYGAVIIGTKGFRAAKSRIVALAVPFTLIPVSAARRVQGSAWSRAGFRGDVHYVGITDPDLARQPSMTAAQAAERREQADADAWMGVISDRLATMYPGARVFETIAAMMAAFPPDPSYGPQRQPCPHCGDLVSDMYDHLATACGTSGLLR